METLRLTSCQAPNAEPACREIAVYLAQKTGLAIDFIDDIPWQEREHRLLEEGSIDIGWICGLPYVGHADRPAPQVELLVAPVMAGQRYGAQPVYFSDVVVRHDSPFQRFADLRGAAWAYNEPASHSGSNVVRYHLAELRESAGFFGRVIESGAHQRSLQLILAGEIDAAAIDSTVLETELGQHPQLASQLRVIDTLGPSPIPPWVVQKGLSPRLKQVLRTAWLNLHTNPQGQAILARAHIARFVKVSDPDYDPIRRMAQTAQRIRW